MSKIIKASIDFSCVGIIAYSIAVFMIALKMPNRSYCKMLEYVGEKLSLNIYIIHMLVYSVFNIVCLHFFKVDYKIGLLSWLYPLLIVLNLIFLSFLLKKYFENTCLSLN